MRLVAVDAVVTSLEFIYYFTIYNKTVKPIEFIRIWIIDDYLRQDTYIKTASNLNIGTNRQRI